MIMRIARPAKHAIVRRVVHGHLRRVGFAKNDCTGGFETGHGGRIRLGNKVCTQ
jgi:hypothetical protein